MPCPNAILETCRLHSPCRTLPCIFAAPFDRRSCVCNWYRVSLLLLSSTPEYPAPKLAFATVYQCICIGRGDALTGNACGDVRNWGRSRREELCEKTFQDNTRTVLQFDEFSCYSLIIKRNICEIFFYFFSYIYFFSYSIPGTRVQYPHPLPQPNGDTGITLNHFPMWPESNETNRTQVKETFHTHSFP